MLISIHQEKHLKKAVNFSASLTYLFIYQNKTSSATGNLYFRRRRPSSLFPGCNLEKKLGDPCIAFTV